jgi:hypothetical protein
MRYPVLAFVLLAASGSAVAQEQQQASPWIFFEEEGGRNGARITGPNDTQIVLKCDKPGRRAVHALVMVPNDRLAVPTTRPISRPIFFQFDDAAPKKEDWGFFEHHAIALGTTSDRALAHLVVGLRSASKVRLRLDTGISSDVSIDFDVTGAREAIARVYEKCGDNAPT